MKNKSLTYIAISSFLLIIAVLFVIFKSKSGSTKIAKNKIVDTKKENVLESAQKTMEEQRGEKVKVVTGKMEKNTPLEVEFMMHDYADVPKSSHSLNEVKKFSKPLVGKAYFEVIETGRADELSTAHQAGKGKEYYYVIYKFKGDKNNPTGNTIYPSNLMETGWDPSPQFVWIDGSKTHYSISLDTKYVLKMKGYPKPPFIVKLTTPNWLTLAAVWKIDKGSNPTIAFKYIDTKGDIHLLELVR